MEVTDVRVFPVNEEKLKAFVSIVLDRCFMVNDIKIIQGRESMFISMPSRRKKNGEFKDVAHPLNNETRRMIEDIVIGEYHRVLEEGPGAERQRPARAEARPKAAPAPAPAAAAGAEDDAPPAPPPVADDEDEKEEQSLEEVAEMHLRDSFWST